MNVAVRVRLGILGTPHPMNPLVLDVGSVGAVSSWSGSYHVLAMGRHYDDYVITERLIRLPQIIGFPAAHPYKRLTGKIRATGVTGNIGEAIAAIFARRHLEAGIGDIAHVRPHSRRKSPDYLMRLNHLMPGPFEAILPQGNSFSWPEWWPVESKARATEAGSNAGRKQALRQLVHYWRQLANSQPAVVGYGVIVTFTYKLPREVCAALILPLNQSQLLSELQTKGGSIDETTLGSCLHAC